MSALHYVNSNNRFYHDLLSSSWVFPRAHLNSVGIIGRVFKESIVGIEDLSGEQKEELPGGASVVQPLLAAEVDVEPVLGQLLLGGRHDLVEGILQQVVAAYHQPEEVPI